MLTKLLTVKAAALAAMLALGATGAAASTGSLPGAAQQTAKDTLAKVGISVPGPDSHAGSHPNGRGQSTGHPASSTTAGPNAHADFGLCTAEKAAAGNPSTTATVFPSTTTCSTVAHPGSPSSTPAGPPPSTPAGPPTSTPASSHVPVTTPNLGSANPGTGSTAGSAGAGNSSNRGRP